MPAGDARLTRRRAIRVGAVALFLAGLALAQQGQILQGNVQKNAGPQVADEIAAGGDPCAGGPGGPNCNDELYAYISTGGTDSTCISLLEQVAQLQYQAAILDRQSRRVPLAANWKQLQQQAAALGKQATDILVRATPYCLSRKPAPAKLIPQGPALTSPNPCTQCQYNYNARITFCQNNAQAFTSAQYNQCVFDANQTFQRCVQSCPSSPNQQTRRKPANPIKDGLDYAHGIADGLGQCVQGFYDLFGAAALMAQGAARMAQGDMSGDEFVKAANLLGLQPGESVTLRSLMSEVQTQVLGVSPYEAGVIAGRRICGYAIAPAAAKAAGALARRVPGTLRGAIGSSPSNPFRGPALAQAADDIKGAPSPLPGKWVAGKMSPVQVGDKLGAGSFGTVFKLPKTPNAIKIGNSTPESAPSFPRQVKGAELLKEANVPTPEIHYWEDPTAPNANGNPGIIVMDDVYQKYPGAQQMSLEQLKNLDGVGKAGPYLDAIRAIDDKLAGNGTVAIDNSPSNIAFVPNGSGGYFGVFWDADMVMPVSDFLKGLSDSNNIATGVFKATLQSRPDLLSKIMNAPAASARQVMDALFEARYSDLQNVSGASSSGTVPGGGGTLPQR